MNKFKILLIVLGLGISLQSFAQQTTSSELENQSNIRAGISGNPSCLWI